MSRVDKTDWEGLLEEKLGPVSTAEPPADERLPASGPLPALEGEASPAGSLIPPAPVAPDSEPEFRLSEQAGPEATLPPLPPLPPSISPADAPASPPSTTSHVPPPSPSALPPDASLEQARRNLAEQQALRNMLLARERTGAGSGTHRRKRKHAPHARRSRPGGETAHAPSRRVGLAPVIALALFVLGALVFLVWSVIQLQTPGSEKKPGGVGNVRPANQAEPEVPKTPVAEPSTRPGKPEVLEEPLLSEPLLDPGPVANP